MKTMITRIHVTRDSGTLFDEEATSISVIDEGGGKFVLIEQPTERDAIAINPEEWPLIRDAIDKMIGVCNE